jgi:murein tripeptide amidase MpaA
MRKMMNINRYLSNEDLHDILQGFLAAYPSLIELRYIGESYEKRPIVLMVITNQDTGPDFEKPAVWIDANIHATEITGTTTAAAIAAHLLQNYQQDSEITRLLNESVFYIVPRVNPDGAALAMAEKPKYLRSGVRPYPYPDRQEGLHAEDIDGDGRILQMRFVDPSGDWKSHPQFPERMIRREPTDTQGTFFRLFSEGTVEDYDGVMIKSARAFAGLDFNRNFPFDWKPEADQLGAGPYPASEPEIKAMVDFIVSHPNINFAITYHTYSRVILRPFSTKPDSEMDTQDLWAYQKIGEIGSELTGYRCVSTFHDFLYHPKEVTTGAFDDWVFDHLGIFSFTIELWDLPTAAGIEDRKFIEWFRKHPAEDDDKIMNWLVNNGPEDSYVPWYTFDHPQLGKVELGGWNTMYTWRNPPPGALEAEVQRNIQFPIQLGKMLPTLAVTRQKLTSLAKDTYHLDLVLDNLGFLPTHTSVQGKQRQAIRPVRIELERSEGVTLLEGRYKIEVGHLKGRSHRLSVTSINANSATDHRARAEWVIKAAPGSSVVVHIYSDRAGCIHLPIKII